MARPDSSKCTSRFGGINRSGGVDSVATTKSGLRRANDQAPALGVEVQVQSKPNRFTGINRSGHGITGSSPDSASVIAKRLYDKRVLSARVTNVDGRVVGGVGKNEGVRVWWAEGNDHE